MAVITATIADGGTSPAEGANIGGGLIVALYVFTGAEKTTSWALQYSPDEGTTWDPIQEEDGTDIVIVPETTGSMHILNPPIRAPFFRLVADTAQTGAVNYEIHTV